MEIAKNLMIILLTGILTENFVLSKFLGICPFLGVSKKLDSSIGMGAAVTFVMVCASLVTYPIYYGILVPLGIEYMNTIAFILVIAVFVQLVEMVLKKYMPPLYKSLGVYGIRNTNTIIAEIIFIALLLKRLPKNSGIVADSRCFDITLVRLPKISHGRSEPSMAFPMPIQVEASPKFQPNLPA